MNITEELKKNQDIILSSVARLELLSALSCDFGYTRESEIFFGVTLVSTDIKQDIYEVLNFLDTLSNYKISFIEE